jgi:hypothetical protein
MGKYIIKFRNSVKKYCPGVFLTYCNLVTGETGVGMLPSYQPYKTLNRGTMNRGAEQ